MLGFAMLLLAAPCLAALCLAMQPSANVLRCGVVWCGVARPGLVRSAEVCPQIDPSWPRAALQEPFYYPFIQPSSQTFRREHSTLTMQIFRSSYTCHGFRRGFPGRRGKRRAREEASRWCSPQARTRGQLDHTRHTQLPPSEVYWELSLAVFAGSEGKHLFHRIG